MISVESETDPVYKDREHEDPIDRLRKLDALRKDGLISDEEFKDKREEIMLRKWQCLNKGTQMNIRIWIMAVSLLFFSAMPALGQSDPAESEISDEEYNIYRAVLADARMWSEVDSRTLAGAWVEADMTIPGDRVRLDRDIFQDLNVKNLKSNRLSSVFLKEMKRGSENSLEGRKQFTFSRVGFDSQKRHALIVVGITFYYPEDIMNEGNYIILEKKDTKWMVVNTCSAWPIRLGKVH